MFLDLLSLLKWSVRVLLYLFCSYTYQADGTIIAINRTRVIHTRRCCDGYVGDDCEIDLCVGLECSEDPTSRCVIAKRCGERFPIFITEQGILSDQCIQPQAAETHLCPGDTYAANSTCTLVDDLGIPNDPLVCLGNGCGCHPGPVWYKVRNGREAECV